MFDCHNMDTVLLVASHRFLVEYCCSCTLAGSNFGQRSIVALSWDLPSQGIHHGNLRPEDLVGLASS